MSEASLNMERVLEWAASHEQEVLTNPSQTNQILLPRPFGVELPVRVVFFAERGLCWMQIELSQEIPAPRQAEVVQALNLINSASYLGAWGLSTRHSKLHFKMSVLTDGVSYSDAAITRLIKTLTSTVAQTARPLLLVALKGAAWDQVLS